MTQTIPIKLPVDTEKRYRRNIVTTLVIALACLFLSAPAMAGFHVNNGKLLDTNGNPFVMRGVNHPHVWYTSRTTQAIKDIASIEGNAVRVVLGNGEQWGPTPSSEVADIIQQLKDNKMIAVLEVHDVTGYPEKPEAAHLSTAVDYWLSIKDVLVGQEDYVIINIGNEPLGNSVAASMWSEVHIDAIKRLRAAGLTHTLMVDAANWGQDWEKIMYADAPDVFNADPQKNIVFSVHMYQVYSGRCDIYDYLRHFVEDLELPLVVGEFGADHAGEEVNEKAILELAYTYQIGYLGWSWSGNSGGVESLDITENFNVENLSQWGDTLINSTYGIKSTAVPASVFNEDGTPFPPKPEPVPEPTPEPDIQVEYAVNQWMGGFNADVTLINKGSSDVEGWNLTWTFTDGQEMTNAWNVEEYTQTVNNISVICSEGHRQGFIPANGGMVTFGFSATDSGTNSIPVNFQVNPITCGPQDSSEPTTTPTPVPTPEPTPEPTPLPTPEPTPAPTPDSGSAGCDGERFGGCGS